MKKLFLAIFLFSLTVSAQINYPNLRPELLEGTTVTIRKLYGTVLDREYKGFYAEKNLSKPYKGNRNLKPEVLEGRTFKVLAVEPYNSELFAKENRWIRLEDTTSKEIVYYQYRLKGNYLEYYFIVDGGLKVPEDFFCDYISGIHTLETPDLIEIFPNEEKGKIVYHLSIVMIGGQWPAVGDEGTIVFTMADGSRIEIPDGTANMFKGSPYIFTPRAPAEKIRQISQGKPVKIEFNKSFSVLRHGDILSGGLRCLFTKPVN